MISKRRITRVIATQACYSSYFCDLSKEELIKNTSALQEIDYMKKYDGELLNVLLEYCLKNRSQDHKTIEMFLGQKWAMERLDFTKVAILRCAICELKYCIDTSKTVIIHEYVTMSDLFLKEKDAGFINAILEKVADYIRPLSNLAQSGNVIN